MEKVKNTAIDYSAAGISAIFSNLAKASEKQHRGEEAELFSQLADWYIADAMPAETESMSFEALADSIKQELSEGFINVREQAAAENDRGTLRALIWGEKATKIQSAVLGRYARQKEELLDDKCIFVCGICGFIYIGDEAPAICPVCKVPSMKILEYK